MQKSEGKKHLTWEAITWIFIILVTTVTVLFFPWYLAQNMLQFILIFVIIASVFWYLRSRQLYVESREKTKKIAEGQAELRVKQRTIDLVFKNSADGMIVLDNDQRIESFSPGMEKMTGYNSDEVVGRLASQVLKFKADKDGSLLPDLMFLPKDVHKNRPYVKNRITTKEGREIDIEASYALVTEEGEHKAIAIVRDITYENELMERDREFVAFTSHQMNTPLSVMRGYLSILLKGKEGKILPKQKKYIAEIYDSTKRLISLTERLLSISRIESEKIKISKDETSAKMLIEELSAIFKATENKEVKLNFELKKDFLFYADKDQLVQALSNLIDNALKYTKVGTVDTIFDKQGDTVIIRVQDTGIGIPKEDVEHIGEKFFRSENAITLSKQGHGLGLFIARTIIDKQGGTLAIDSALGKGTKVTVSLPRGE